MLPIERWETFEKAIRKTKLVINFIHKIRKQVIEVEYRKIALNHLIRQVRQLYPFLDENKLPKVGGRLLAADCLAQETYFQS